MARTEWSLSHVSGCYPEPMIGLVDVELCKIAGAQQAVNFLPDMRPWLLVCLGDLVKILESHA